MVMHKIVTAKGLRSQALFIGDKKVAEIANPVASDDWSLVRESLFMNPKKVPALGYDNTIVEYLNSKSPGVTISSFVLAEALSGIPEVRGASRIADLGCGVGFLGNYVAKNFEGVQFGSVAFCDLVPEATSDAYRAYLFNNGLNPEQVVRSVVGNTTTVKGKSSQTIELIVGNALETMKGKSADVAVACPLLVPGLVEVFPRVYAVFGSIAKSLGADFYFAHTSLVDAVVNEAAAVTGAKHERVSSRPMPFVLYDLSYKPESLSDAFAFDGKLRVSPEVVKRLVGLGLKVNGENDFSHQIRVVKFSYK